MKKKIICSAVLTALLSASSIALAGGPEIMPEPDYFSGFYLGGIGGVHHNTFQGDSQVILDEDFIIPGEAVDFTFLEAGILNDNNLSGGEFDGYGGIQGGFGKVFAHQFYAGVQGWGEWGSTSLSETQTLPVLLSPVIVTNEVEDTFFVFPSATASTTTTMKISNDYGVAAKIGWVVAPRSMFYGKIGASWASVEVTNSLDVDTTTSVFDDVGAPFQTIVGDLSTGTESHSDTKIGLLLGIGFEQFVYQDVVSINVEYTYVNYGHVSVTTDELSGTSLVTPADPAEPVLLNLVNDTDVVSRASTSVQVSSLMAGLNFYFGRDWI